MARIRSIHPGFWTDEDILGLSPEAKLTFIGLWTQAGDQGNFPYRLNQLAARLNMYPVESLAENIAELETAGLVQLSPEMGGGVVVDMKRWQDREAGE